MLAKSDIRFWEIAVERFFVFYCFCQYIDKVNDENWQNVLININFCQYFTNILWINLHTTCRLKKIKGLFALLAWKSGGSVGRSFFFFFFLNSGHEEMQCHSCVCILGHGEPQNWFNPGVGRSCIRLKCLFWDSYYIFWHFNNFV